MKKTKKYLGLTVITIMAMLVLTGCAKNGSVMAPPASGPYAWIYKWIGIPLQNIMLACSRAIGGSNGAGWAIIVMTLIVRTILLPLMLNQQKKSTQQQEKMARVQPQMQLIQQAMKDKTLTQDQQMQLATWQRELYSKNNLSLTGGMGCLPLLIQLPIMVGIYQAVMYSKELANSSFFGISLSQKSFLLAIIATIFALIQGYMSLIGLSKEQKKQMQMTIYMNPIMTMFIGMSVSGSVTLYWAAGNFFMIIQQLIVTFIIMPKVKKQVDEELKAKPIEEVVTKAKIDALKSPTPSSPAAKQQVAQNQKLHENLRSRNQGKQTRKH